MDGLNDLAVSSGSACINTSQEPSYVLKALGVENSLAYTSVRIGFGRFTTEEEVDYALDLLVKQVNKITSKL